jgi:hypothetical protein
VLDLGECAFRWFSVLVCGVCARWRIFINESHAACSWFCGVTSRVKSWILITKFCCSKFPSTRFALDFFLARFQELDVLLRFRLSFSGFWSISDRICSSSSQSEHTAHLRRLDLTSCVTARFFDSVARYFILGADISVSYLDISVSCLPILVSGLHILVSHFVFRFSAAVPFLLFGLSPQSAPASLSELKFPPSLRSYRFPSRH